MNKISPAFNNKNCIILSSNNVFVPAVSVLIQSILEHSSSNNYDIIILHKDISNISQKTILDMINKDNISIRFIDIRQYIHTSKFYTSNRKSLTEEAYFRLFTPWILDNNYNYALYLDSDMIVRDDIINLFNIDLGEKLIAAVKDYWGICNYAIENDKTAEYRKNIGINNIYDYVISSTILFNLPLWRDKYSLEYVLELSKKENWKQHDQDVINILANDSIYHISPEWGYVSDYGNNCYLPIEMQEEIIRIMNNPKVVHYAGGRKPWIKAYDEFCLDFWKFAIDTPFFADLLSKVKSLEYRNYIIKNIKKIEIDRVNTANGIHYFYKGVLLERMELPFIKYHLVNIENNNLYLEGTIAVHNASIDDRMEIFLLINGEKYSPNIQNDKYKYVKNTKNLTSRGKWFSFSLNLNDFSSKFDVKLLYQLNSDEFLIQRVDFDKYSPFSRKKEKEFFVAENWIIEPFNTGLRIVPYKSSKVIRNKEITLLKTLLKTKKLPMFKAVFIRTMVNMLKLILKKPIWLISDRISCADDNGRAFFEYICKEKRHEVTPYFLIKKDSADYLELKKIGKVVEPYSWKHKILQLIASLSISSQTDSVFRNPFGKYGFLYQDLLSKVKFVFLQHGIIFTDLSAWLNKRNQQMSGFVVSSLKEYEQILNGNYDYTANEIWLTGLARFDRLEDKKEKCITFQPTWRKYLALKQNQNTGIWMLKPNFYHSEYATFYREVITNERLRNKAQELGYKIQFKIHPSFLSHEKEFGFDEKVNLVPMDKSYKDIYAESSLIISDYSSSILDFLYLRKPVIYCQFDFDEFFSGGHQCEAGDFNYESDGFGEVEYTIENTVDRIIEYMENDCQLKPKYKERVDKFFAYHDKNNCKRIYDKCKNLN